MGKLKVGAVLYNPKVTVIWHLIEDYFKEHNFEIEAVFFKDYDLQVSALEKKEIDLAWNSPLARLDTHIRLQSKDKYGPMRDTDRDLHTNLIVRKDAQVDSVKALCSKKIGFGALDSPQARLIPIYFLHTEGLEYNKDYTEVRFDIGVGLHGDHVGGEKDAVQALIDKKVDAAFTLEKNYTAWIKDGTIDENSVKVLAQTPVFDHCLFSAHEGVSDADINTFSQILLKMDYSKPKEKEIMDMEGLKRWVEGRTSGYELLTQANAYLSFLAGFNKH